MRCHCPPDTGFESRALAVWGRARYLSYTEAPHNTEFHTWMGKKHFYFFQTAGTGNRTPNSSVNGSGANHYPRAPGLKLHGEHTILQPFRRIELIVHIAISVLLGTHFDQVKWSIWGWSALLNDTTSKQCPKIEWYISHRYIISVNIRLNNITYM